MSEADLARPDTSDGSSAGRQLSTLDRLLPLWIGAAMVAGLVLGRAFPELDEQLDKIKIDTVSLPIAIGLLAMMSPVLAKVRYRSIGAVVADRRACCQDTTLLSTRWTLVFR